MVAPGPTPLGGFAVLGLLLPTDPDAASRRLGFGAEVLLPDVCSALPYAVDCFEAAGSPCTHSDISTIGR